jgi:hypothetical protein
LASDRRVVPTWRYVRQNLDEAARGGDAMDLAVALQIALHLEGVECQAEAAPVSAALDGREHAQSFNAYVANQACTMLHRPSRENRCRPYSKLIGSYLAVLGVSTPANCPMR